MSASRVKDFVGLLYASLKYSPTEKLLVAKNTKANPYPAAMTLFQREAEAPGNKRDVLFVSVS
jgi:hypothetical protein